ncbi:MAG: methyltransferase domain-containing protein [Saprospiraceae bacterium]|nr:methyltransferase domain-containing protein [Saprospiraceae bacterium]
MFEYHRDKERYFDMQYRTARDFIIPFIEEHQPLLPGQHVLEIGCAEAGVLKAFRERGMPCTGVDLNATRIEWARQLHLNGPHDPELRLFAGDVFAYAAEFPGGLRFDWIILKDVIEHIPGQEKFVLELKSLLKPGGHLFFGFPPWQMPFGGHQQMARSRMLSRIPWLHLVPKKLYKFVLESAGEEREVVGELLEIADTGLSIERFEAILLKAGLVPAGRRLFLTNPIYAFKFGIHPREVPSPMAKMPWIRNFYCTAAYYLVRPKAI